MAVRGWVQACEWQPRGSELTADAAVGATVLHIEDPTDYDAGGMVAINDEFHTYSEVDEDAETITLDLGLTAAATVGDPVNTLSGGQLVRDVVLFVACGDGDLVEVAVNFAQRDYWPEGDYDDPVQVLLSDDLEQVLDAPGRAPQSVELDETRTGLEAALAELEADLTELNEVTLPAVQADLAELVTDLTGLAGLFPITSTSISDNAITTPKLATNAVTADKITANSIGTGHLVALAVTGDKIAANTISADKIIANSIGADRLTANAIDGMTITGAFLVAANIATNPGVNQGIKILDSGSVFWFDNSYTQVASVSASSGNAAFNAVTAGDLYSTGDVSAHDGFFDLTLAGGGTTGASINNNGKILRTPSTRRVKENIEPLPLEQARKVLSVEAATFNFIDRESFGDAVHLSAIAEQVVEVAGDLFATFDADGQPSGIRESAMLVAAIQVIRDLSARVEALEAP